MTEQQNISKLNNENSNIELEQDGKVEDESKMKLPYNLYDILGEESKTIYARILLFMTTIGDEHDSLSIINEARELAFPDGDVGGVLISQANSTFVLLEGPSESVIYFIPCLLESFDVTSSPISSIRVACFCDDIEPHMNQTWFTHNVANPSKETVTAVEEENVDSIILDAYANSEWIGIQMANSHETLDGLKLRHPEKFPKPEVVRILSKSNILMTLEEFQELYAPGFAVTTVSEEIWPYRDLNSVLDVF